MADEPVAAPEPQDTPPAAPAEGTPAPEPTGSPDNSPDTDWEQRYNDLRPEFDRRNQLLAAARGEYGPQVRAEALDELGVELADEPDDDPEFDQEFPDPVEEVQSLREEIEAERTERKERELAQMEDEYIEDTVEEIEAKEGVELSEKEFRTIVNNALANRLEGGRPDLEGAFADLKEIQGAARDRIRDSKRSSAQPPVGTPGEDKIDLSDDEARLKYMTEVYEAEEGQPDS